MIRQFHRLYAWFFGYYWLPCPICGENYGGHEAGGALMYSPIAGLCVCKKCVSAADKQNAKKFGIVTIR